jgi:hypothetical protein
MFAKRLKRGRWRWCLGFWWGGAARWGDGDENPRGGGHGRQRRLEGRWLPFREAAPCPFFFLGIGAGVQEVLALLGGCQGREISWLWMDAAKSRVSSQYIEVEVKSWSWWTPLWSKGYWTPPKPSYNSPLFSLWVNQVLPWPKSPKMEGVWVNHVTYFRAPKLTLYPSVIWWPRRHPNSDWDDFYV